MHVDLIALAMCAWLLTYALHSCVWIALAWATSTLLAHVGRLHGALALVRERLWKLALVGGIATATIQTALGGGPWNLVPESRRPAAETAPAVESVATLPAKASQRTQAIPVFLDSASFARSLDEMKRSSEFVRPEAPTLALPAVDNADRSTTTLALSPLWIRIILGVWIGGVLLGLARWALDWRRLVKALRGRARIASGPAHEVYSALVKRSGAGAHVQLLHAPRIAAPITIGLLRPAICLPPRAEAELQRDELEALLAHELAHALRRDPAWLSACRAIEVALFFQPLNRLARVRLADEAEYLCDDWAVRHTRERLPLASCLTEIAGWIVGRERELSAPGMAARGSRLELRVRRLLDGGDGRDGERSELGTLRWMTPVACGAFGAVALFVPGVSAKGGVEGDTDLVAETNAANEPIDVVARDRFEDVGYLTADDEIAPDSDDDEKIDARAYDAEAAILLALRLQGFATSPATPVLAAALGAAEPSVPAASEAKSEGESQPAPCATVESDAPCTAADTASTPAAPETESSQQPARAPRASVPAAPRLATPAPAAVKTEPKSMFRFDTAPVTGSTGHLLGDALTPTASYAESAQPLPDAQSFEADIASLEASLKALKTELSRHKAPSEFRRRINLLEGRLRTLKQLQAQLVLLASRPEATGVRGVRAVAPGEAQSDESLTTNDRK